MKNLNELDKFCVFTFTTKSLNEYKFSIGSVDNKVDLSFDKFGDLTSSNFEYSSTQFQFICQNSSLFSLHTKLTDIIGQTIVQTSLYRKKKFSFNSSSFRTPFQNKIPISRYYFISKNNSQAKKKFFKRKKKEFKFRNIKQKENY